MKNTALGNEQGLAAPNENSLKIFYSTASRQTFDVHIPEAGMQVFAYGQANTTGDHHILTDNFSRDYSESLFAIVN